MSWEIREGDALARLREMPDASVHCVVTSPPYWGLRDYGVAGQLGLERTPEEYTAALVGAFAEVRRVLREDGTLWLNLGDSYASDVKGSGGKANSTLNAKRDAAGVVVGKSIVTYEPRKLDHGLKAKDLCGIPWRVFFALQADGWWLRSDIVWHKPNPMPESVQDRPTKAHEYVGLFAKAETYFYDADAIAEPLATDPRENYPARAKITGRGEQGAADARGSDRDKSGGFPPKQRSETKTRPDADLGGDSDRRWPVPAGAHQTAERGPRTPPGPAYTRNRRSVWTIATTPYPEAHFATFPPELPELCIKAGCPEGGTVLDPFAGAGTTGLVATRLGRNFIGIELSPTYAALARKRIDADCPLFNRTDGAA